MGVGRQRRGLGRLAAALLSACLLLAFATLRPGGVELISGSGIELIGSGGGGGRDGALPAFKPLPGIQSRRQMGALLEADGAKVGVELGVQRGEFAAQTLRAWPSCQRYILVDAWAKLPHYEDLSNVDDDEQEEIMREAQRNLAAWRHKTVWIKNLTSAAAPLVPDGSLDYVYIDARHDYCGVAEDLRTWWPKLKPGGVFAGHDYVTANMRVVKESGQDWSVCMDGSRHEGAVKGAVDEFAAAHGLLVVTTTLDDGWESWITRKPGGSAARAARIG